MHQNKMDARGWAMTASLLVSFLMLAGKTVAYFMTGSVAIMSDALESVIHLLATGFAAFSLWYSVRPADRGHPYGHGKIAYFSSGFEGALIMIAASVIMYAGIADLIKGPEVERLSMGLLITGGLALVNLILGLWLVRVGKSHDSVVLISNGRHVLTDMWTSVGVVGGLALVWVTDLVWLDPVLAIIVALNILWMAVSLMKQAISGLMEQAIPADTETILEILEEAKEAGTVSGYHQLRHRRVNDQLFVEYHLQFPGQLSVAEAHRRSHEVEDNIQERFGIRGIIVTAHLEPESHESAHKGRLPEPGDALA
jgi:cation diffusion facilitator family transporter